MGDLGVSQHESTSTSPEQGPTKSSYLATTFGHP